MSYDVDALRQREFPWAARGERRYLNNASTGPLPERTVQAVGDAIRMRAEPYRLHDDDLFAILARARALSARLIGAAPAEIALSVNTTYGLNIAAQALPLVAGDVVLAFDREFPANIYPWMALEEAKGVMLRLVPCANGLPDEDELVRRLDDARVRVVAVSWVSFASGARVDLARLGRLCRERGIYFVVDAIQGVGATPLDVHECQIDILACGGQKWLLSPWGTGFTYVREALVQQLRPVTVGWMAVRGSDDFTRLVDYDLTWRDDARRFEVITLPFHDFAGFNASLGLLFELGIDAVAAHVAALATAIVTAAAAHAELVLATPAQPAARAGIVSVRPRDAAAASARLERVGITHTVREGAIRLSPHCYNTLDEVERAVAALPEPR